MILGQEIIHNFANKHSKIMDYQNLLDEQFKRRFGVYKQTYRKMVESVKSVEAELIQYLKGDRNLNYL
ncbi:hypothetical protein MICAG_1260013 [Microcystis aeruginosa PCC 9808]|uniref:Uncharacterized protein n=1 Tax=Microcystis aeruginosa PCC 9808 TaxID=1160284 RepID=I4HGQ9_MICAE|nr:hypothetical protein MICAG_1260013 [Microcystis aeruginosa PCC 9808]